ncbi:MAG: EAL domain-containing protein [Afipia sp.]|nr:EAL domain-containing protein [Afipia sp.]
MVRVSTIFIAICMVLIAASFGLILYAMTGLSMRESALVALAAFVCLILYNAISMRIRGGTDASGQIADLSRGTADLARQVAEYGRRMALIESRLASADNVAQDRARAVMGEIGELGVMIKHLAGSVATHDELLTSATSLTVAHHPSQPQMTSAPQIQPVEPVHAAEPPAPVPVALQAAAEAISNLPDMLAAIKNATEANRIDLYLQPIVSLPQRKVRFYEAVSRLRDEKDHVFTAGQFIDIAEASGVVGQIDYTVLFRCVQVLRRLQVRTKDVGMFCNISGVTLANPDIFGECIAFLEANRALAPSLVLEFKQSAFRSLGPIEIEHLAALKRLGFQFSIDNIADLRIDGRELADRGVRYIKVPASLLLDQKEAASSDIHTADLTSLLTRFGIDLIAEKIEGERSVADLLDYDVRFGQGFLFSAPRPLRPEAAVPTPVAASRQSKAPSPPPAEPAAVAARAAAETRLSGTAALARRIAQS